MQSTFSIFCKIQRLAIGILSILFSTWVVGQPLVVTYAGGSGNEVFYDAMQLSDGTFLVVGAADDLSWIPATTSTVILNHPSIANNQGTNKFAFILHLNDSLSRILRVAHLPQGVVEDFRFIKSTNSPRTATGELYLSANTADSNTGGYIIARLNGNFINQVPTGLAWVKALKCANGDYPKNYHPWDVDSNGNLVYVRGDSHDYNWSIAGATDANGNNRIMPGWRMHWRALGGEYRGPGSSYPGTGADTLIESGIVFKRDARCELRSHTQADYDLMQADGNGGLKKGKWPLDILFNGPCDPSKSGQSTSGPGYTGYRPPGTFTYGPSSVVIDRRTNWIYLGFNAKSVLPGGNPDFEPAVMAMDPTGDLKWWSRLYHEITPTGDTMLSSPDQYIDGLAVDYSLPASQAALVVQARCHGNNVENFWEGNTIHSNSSAAGFQNRFTGTSGNIHISWLGKLGLDDGGLQASTYVAEYAEGASGLGTAHPDQNLGGWPNPNAGWPTLNTTRLARNNIKVTANGSVCIIGQGRRTMTTANAYQRMPRPGGVGLSAWNNFARQYSADLKSVPYSSLVVGQWDTLTQQGGGNVQLYGIWKTANGLLAVGKHSGSGNDLPVTNVPTWGTNAMSNENAVLVHLTAANIKNLADGPMGGAPLGLRQTFDVSLQDNGSVLLSWTDRNASGMYDLYRKGEQSEEVTIGSVTSTGQSIEIQYRDRQAPPGLAHYRCVHVDSDGNKNLLGEKSIFIPANWKLKLVPNPVNDVCYLQGAFDPPVALNFFNAHGKLVYSKSVEQNTEEVDLSVLPAGHYFVTFQSSRGWFGQRIIKQ